MYVYMFIMNFTDKECVAHNLQIIMKYAIVFTITSI